MVLIAHVQVYGWSNFENFALTKLNILKINPLKKSANEVVASEEKFS